MKKQQRIYIAGWELYKEHSGPSAELECETLSLIDEGNRFVIIENTNDPYSGLSSVTRYQHPNHQGSTTLETDEYSNIISYEEYHPFGTTSYQATNGSVTAAAKRYRYTGMERDDETGLEYHQARYYIPWLGRWMNFDPIGIGDGVNVYAYCRNNPVGNVDSSGTQTEEKVPPLLAVGTGNNTIGPQPQPLNGGTLDEIIVTPNTPGASDLLAVPTAATSAPAKNGKAQTSLCEDCPIEGLEDGDYFSDVQDQYYYVSFENISQESFDKFKEQLLLDPGKIINNDKAKYYLVDRDGSGGVSKGDHFDIKIFPDNGFVLVDSVINTKNFISATVKTLYGHPDAGANTFRASYDQKTKTMIWVTHNISRSNDAMTQGIGAGIFNARGQQQQWKNVLLQVHKFMGSPSTKSSFAIVKEFDYNDYKNKIGDEEKDESFTENLLPLFIKKR